MCRDLDKLYYQACGLCRRLYYHHYNDPRYRRIYAKAEERRERRGAVYQECLEARNEMLSYEEQTMELDLSSLYRVTIPNGGSEYWKVLEIASEYISLRCLAVGRRSEYIHVNYKDVIVTATRPEFVGAHVTYAPFDRN